MTAEVVAGTLISTESPGIFGIIPRSPVAAQGLARGDITQFRMIAEPSPRDFEVIIRFLLKMGVETLAHQRGDLALDPRFDLARGLARAPTHRHEWWALIQHDSAAFAGRIAAGAGAAAWDHDIAFGVTEVEGIFVFDLRFADHHAIVPLEPGFLIPDRSEFPPPQNHIVIARL